MTNASCLKEVRGDELEVREAAAIDGVRGGHDGRLLGLSEYLAQVDHRDHARRNGSLQNSARAHRRQLICIACTIDAEGFALHAAENPNQM